MRIICISGAAGSGKDTAASLIAERLTRRGKSVLITHYADLLKFMCKQLFDWNGEKDEAGRQMLQYVGTDVVRAHDPNCWVDFIIWELMLFKDHWDCVIIPDCRFPNELNRLKESGFDVVHVGVERPGLASTLTEEQKQHASETSMANVTPDFTLHNNGTITMLAAAVMHLLKDIPI